MCVPGISASASSADNPLITAGERIFSAVSEGSSSILPFVSSKKNYEYRRRVAINNANLAYREGLRQKQLGIEQSRVEKISGFKEANKLLAKNSASGLDVASQNNALAYQDLLNASEINADLKQREYDYSANDYFNKANQYLNSADEAMFDYNQSVFDNSLNALGRLNKVSNVWFPKPTKGAK